MDGERSNKGVVVAPGDHRRAHGAARERERGGGREREREREKRKVRNALCEERKEEERGRREDNIWTNDVKFKK
jgi:hypothetical protein